MYEMILLNTCSTNKIQLTDSEPRLFFSLTMLNPDESVELRLMDNVIVDRTTAEFLRDFQFSWIGTDRILGVRVDADKDTCRAFLSEHLSVDGEVFLKNE